MGPGGVRGPEGSRAERGGAERSGGPKGWGLKGGGPEGWGPAALRLEGWGPEGVGARRGGGAQNFALFFPSPAPIFALFFFFFLSLWGSSRGLLVVFEARGPSNVQTWALGLSCETPAAQNVHI